MAELKGVDAGTHLKAIVSEFESKQSIYGHPPRKLYRGFSGFDFSVDFHGQRAATPLGPASGPHTQMAQNIILSFLGGGRIMELKTIQILDRLNIARPCIDVRNVGYNIEWSQELSLEESYQEYVNAWVLLKIIEEMELLGIAKDDPFYDTVFDISVGYDLEGISSARVKAWLKGMQDASEGIDKSLQSLSGRFSQYRKLAIEPRISNSVTLSTFHGCPREEIEAIVEHLISEYRFHVIVKMNPTILGYELALHMLHEGLGYHHIELDAEAFDNDLQFDDGIAMMKRLQKFADNYDCRVGAKFTNTLVVKNRENIFKDEVMYLSGPPLHVLSMNAMHRFRQQMGDDFHISFSAGITKHNFVDAVRCNMRPVSTCTDLLTTGGYTRLFDYLKNLKKEMAELDCDQLDDFIIKSAGGAEKMSVARAGVINSNRIVPRLIENPRYHERKNRKAPPKIDSHLTLFDCITCNKCLPVCPNAANFSIPTGQVSVPMTDYRLENGELRPIEGDTFTLKKSNQIANLADFCNECGDCDTYCPEYGGPFIEKPRFFLSKETYRSLPDYDGFYFVSPYAITGRLQGVEYSLAFDALDETYIWQSPVIEITLDRDHRALSYRTNGDESGKRDIDMYAYYAMRALLDGILNDPGNFPSVLLRGTEPVTQR